MQSRSTSSPTSSSVSCCARLTGSRYPSCGYVVNHGADTCWELVRSVTQRSYRCSPVPSTRTRWRWLRRPPFGPTTDTKLVGQQDACELVMGESFIIPAYCLMKRPSSRCKRNTLHPHSPPKLTLNPPPSKLHDGLRRPRLHRYISTILSPQETHPSPLYQVGHVLHHHLRQRRHPP